MGFRGLPTTAAPSYQVQMEVREFETEVIKVIEQAPHVKSFRFAVPDDVDLDFEPGQFFVVTIKINSKESSKHFSFSNSPTEKGYIEFTKRITESEFSRALDLLKTGDRAKLKLPFGFFTFKGEYDKVAFLTGGIGITCIRSMCKYITDKGIPTDIVLLYSNHSEKDIVFREDFSKMETENSRFKVIHTLTSPDMDKNTWKGRTGLISSSMIKEEVPDLTERVFYLCGPPKMVDALKSILSDELTVDKERIKWEHFTGY